ncbi:hypothetical protein WMY93_021252 [Mugilogobius chulae]|uniref:Uncharacterized protein n=1 Tax=Mugilogobius chulae TaxID=88201 RepID=A0AAW0NA41_9GOBI
MDSDVSFVSSDHDMWGRDGHSEARPVVQRRTPQRLGSVGHRGGTGTRSYTLHRLSLLPEESGCDCKEVSDRVCVSKQPTAESGEYSLQSDTDSPPPSDLGASGHTQQQQQPAEGRLGGTDSPSLVPHTEPHSGTETGDRIKPTQWRELAQCSMTGTETQSKDSTILDPSLTQKTQTLYTWAPGIIDSRVRTQHKTSAVTKCEYLKWPTIQGEKGRCVIRKKETGGHVFHTRRQRRNRERRSNVFVRSEANMRKEGKSVRERERCTVENALLVLETHCAHINT